MTTIGDLVTPENIEVGMQFATAKGPNQSPSMYFKVVAVDRDAQRFHVAPFDQYTGKCSPKYEVYFAKWVAPKVITLVPIPRKASKAGKVVKKKDVPTKEKLLALLKEYSCNDSCIFWPNVGMSTNGGCRHLHEFSSTEVKRQVQSVLYALQDMLKEEGDL